MSRLTGRLTKLWKKVFWGDQTAFDIERSSSGIALNLHISVTGSKKWRRWHKIILFTCSTCDSSSGSGSPWPVLQLINHMWYYSASSTGISEWSRGQADWDWNVHEGEHPRKHWVRRSACMTTRKRNYIFNLDFCYTLADWQSQYKKLMERVETAQGVWSLGWRNVIGESATVGHRH